MKEVGGTAIVSRGGSFTSQQRIPCASPPDGFFESPYVSIVEKMEQKGREDGERRLLGSTFSGHVRGRPVRHSREKLDILSAFLRVRLRRKCECGALNGPRGFDLYSFRANVCRAGGEEESGRRLNVEEK
jgi:hypothetical protein